MTKSAIPFRRLLPLKRKPSRMAQIRLVLVSVVASEHPCAAIVKFTGPIRFPLVPRLPVRGFVGVCGTIFLFIGKKAAPAEAEDGRSGRGCVPTLRLLGSFPYRMSGPAA